jgi:recombination protein RecA
MTLDKDLQQIARQFGDEMILDLKNTPVQVEVISSGVPSIDRALQIVDARTMKTLAVTDGHPVLGGYARGRVTELFGPESGGKTTLALTHAAEVIKLGGTAVLMDVENKAQPNYIRAVMEEAGADADSLHVLVPPHAEAAWESVRKLVGVADCIIIDSIAEMMTRARMDAEVGDQQPGMLARIVKDGLYKSKIGTSKTILLVLNQVRDTIGGYGSYEHVPGGHALKHKASSRIRVSRVGKAIQRDGREVGINVRVRVEKNQIGIPNGIAMFKMYWGLGVDAMDDLINVGKALDLVMANGGWYYLAFENSMGSSEEYKLQRSEFYETVRGDKAVMEELRAAIASETGAEL